MLTIHRLRAGLCAAVTILVLGSPVITRAQAQPAVTVRLVLGQSDTSADGYFAYESGIFKKNGLNVELTQVRSGAVAATAIASGAADMGDSNLISVATAKLKDIPFIAIAPGYIYDSSDPYAVLAVAPNSPIRTPKDLNGKTIGVPVLNGMSVAVIPGWADSIGGGDWHTYKYVELPVAETVQALERGTVAAAIIQDPVWAAESSRLRVLGTIYDVISKRFLTTVWFTTIAYAQKNPDVIRRFQLSINEAAAWADRNPELAKAALEKQLKYRITKLRHYHTDRLDPAQMQSMLDFATKYQMLPRSINANDLIYVAPK